MSDIDTDDLGGFPVEASPIDATNLNELPDPVDTPPVGSTSDPAEGVAIINRRAAAAAAAVKAHSAGLTQNPQKTPATDAVTDTIRDLRHLCDALGMDWDETVLTASDSYDEDLFGGA